MNFVFPEFRDRRSGFREILINEQAGCIYLAFIGAGKFEFISLF